MAGIMPTATVKQLSKHRVLLISDLRWFGIVLFNVTYKLLKLLTYFDFVRQVLESGIMELLCSLLELGVNKECEEAAIHSMVILGLLTDAGNRKGGKGRIYP